MALRPGAPLLALALALALACLALAAAPPVPKAPAAGVAISDRTVLLPQTSARSRVPFVLRAHNGCFKWTNSNPDDLLMTVVLPAGEAPCEPSGASPAGAEAQPPCSTEVVLSAQATPHGGRTASTVTAEDAGTGHLVRCEVFLDRIARLEILTTTRIMHRDTVEVLRVRAFDPQGNVFSSLEGLQFHWSILPSNPAEASGVLKFVAFKDSSVDVSPAVALMEAEHKEGDSKLVQGISVGRATVSVRLLEPDCAECAEVPPASALITVLEPLELQPAHAVYVAPGAQLRYRLMTLRRNALAAVEMPSPHYLWLTANHSVATVDPAGLARAIALGVTDVKVQSANLTDNEARGVLHVVPPGYIALAIRPLDAAQALAPPAGEAEGGAGAGRGGKGDSQTSNWVLVAGGTYALEVETYDLQGHRLHTADNLRFTAALEPAHLRLLSSAPNQALHHLEAQAEGATTITAALTEVRDARGAWQRLAQPIAARQDALVTSRVRLAPHRHILLPVEGAGPAAPRHQFQLTASGGSGEYVWYSADAAVVAVNAGLLTAQVRGDALITVADKRNALNHDAVPASALGVGALDLVPERLEAQVGFPLLLPLAARDAHGRPFDNCSALPFEFLWADDAAVFSLLPAPPDLAAAPLPPGACAVRTLLALKEGHATLTLGLPGSRLRDEVTLFAFAPLQLSPADRAVVTLGASATLLVAGGPAPWLYEPAAHLESVAGPPSAAAQVAIRKAPRGSGGVRAYALVCLAHGEQLLTVTVGNRPTASHPHPALVNASVRFVCRHPDLLVLYPTASLPPPPAAPLLPPGATLVESRGRKCTEATAVPSLEALAASGFAAPLQYQLRGERRLAFASAALDELGRPFANHSTLLLRWAASNASLGRWLPPGGPDDAALGLSDPRTQRVLDLGREEGLLLVSLTAAEYDEAALRAAGVAPAAGAGRGAALKVLARELELSLRANVRLAPGEATLFNHEDNLLRLSTAGGSGSLALYSNNTAALRFLRADEGGAHIDAVPQQAGAVEVTVVDTCLGWSEPAHALVRVSDIARLELRVRRTVRLGESVPLDVEAYDDRGARFDDAQATHMHFNFSLDHPLLEVLPAPPGARPRYLLRGVALGKARLAASARLPPSAGRGLLVASPARQIEVYGPLEVQPRTLVLLPDAAFQLQWTGGPSVDAEVACRVHDAGLANVSAAGLVTALAVGAGTVACVAEGYDADSGERLLFGQDAVQLHVRLLTGLHLFALSAALAAGRELTARVGGTSGETPFSFGGLGALGFRWESANPAVAQLWPVHAAANASLDDERGWSVRVRAQAAGTARLVVRLPLTPATRRYVDPRSAGPGVAELSASLLLSVAEPLRLLAPAPGPDGLLVPPFARLQLVTNRGAGAALAYRVLSDAETSDSRVLDVSARGLLAARGRPGQAIVVLRDEEAGQQLALQVTVKAPSVLQLLPDAPPPLDAPLGSTVRLLVQVRDEAGRPFDVYEGLAFAVQSSNTDVLAPVPGTAPSARGAATATVALENGTSALLLKALRPGEAVVRVSLRHAEGLDDYLRLRVSNAILPAAPRVHVGGRVRFSTTFAEADAAAAPLWRSDNERVMAVGPGGLGEARAPGRALVFHEGAINTFAQASVTRVAAIEVDLRAHGQPGPLSLPAGRDHRYPLRFIDSTGAALSLAPLSASNPVEHNVAFSCAIEGPGAAWAYATAEQDGEAAHCVVHPRAPDAAQLLEGGGGKLPTALTLAVTARDRAASYECAQYHTLPFVSGFLLARRGEVVLSARRPRLVLDVLVPSARTALVATSADAARVEVRELQGLVLGDDQPDVRRFEIRPAGGGAPDAPFSGVLVTFLDPATQQQEALSVSYAPPADPAAGSGAAGDEAFAAPDALALAGRRSGDAGGARLPFGLKLVDAVMLGLFVALSALLALAVRCLFARGTSPYLSPYPAPAAPSSAASPPPSAFSAASAYGLTPGGSGGTPFKASSPFRRTPTFFGPAFRSGAAPSSAVPPSPTTRSPLTSY